MLFRSGVVAMAGAFSTAAALVLFGEVHDATGNYDIAMVIGAALFALGAAICGITCTGGCRHFFPRAGVEP